MTGAQGASARCRRVQPESSGCFSFQSVLLLCHGLQGGTAVLPPGVPELLQRSRHHWGTLINHKRSEGSMCLGFNVAGAQFEELN